MTETSPMACQRTQFDLDVSFVASAACSRTGRVLYQHKLELTDSYLEEVIIFLNEEI
jgi:hypothetical protein